MTEKRFNVILKCEQKGNKQECEYYVEINGVETSIKDILNENEQLKKILEHTVYRIDAEYPKRVNPFYSVSLSVSGEMYDKIREICFND